MHGQPPPDRRRGSGPPRDDERRAARAARRRERAARTDGAPAGPAGASGRPPGREPGRGPGGGAAASGGSRVYGSATALAEREPEEEAPPERRRTPLWAKLTLTFGALIILISGTTFVGYNVAVGRYAGNVQQENLLGAAAADPGEELDGPVNILLLGVDARQDETEDVRSDAIMVLHVPSTHDQAYLISVPRDTWVSVPGYWDMKITESFYYGAQNGGGWEGGTQLVARSLYDLTGLQFNAAAMVNFGGFEKIINEMGGIEYCVETGATSEHWVLVNGERMGIAQARREGHNFEPVRYEVGCQKLDGWQALDYVRQRKQLDSGEGDYGRQLNQKLLLQAMAKQATSSDVMANLGTLDRLLLAAGDAVVVDTNNVEIIDFLFTMRNIAANDMVALRTNGGEFNPDTINGISVERLTPESMEMFRAAATDSMAQFVINHPDFVGD